MSNRVFSANALPAGMGRAAAIYTVPWLLLSCIFVFANLIRNRLDPEPFSDLYIVLHTFSIYLLWALFTPFIVALQRRQPLTWPIRQKPLLRHLLLMSVLILLHAVIMAFTSLRWPSPSGVTGFWPNIAQEILWRGPFAITLYVIVVTAMAAWQAIARERSFVQAQLDSLKSQLEPHFLFNVLNVLSELVYSDPAAADRVLTQLSVLLRQSLEQPLHVHPLRSELALLDQYLAIQQILLGDRLQLHKEVDRGLLDVDVPAMILQPIMENAIRHGIALLPEAGTITLLIGSSDGQMCVLVSNDGPASNRELLRKEGIGLRNTRARLHALYGENQTCTLAFREEGGARVELNFPLHKGAHQPISTDADTTVFPLTNSAKGTPSP